MMFKTFICIIIVFCLASSTSASDKFDSNSNIFNNGIWWITINSSEPHLGMMEVYLDGEYKGECSRLDFGHKVEDTESWPTVAVIYSSGYLRLKECKPDVNFGTSFVLGPGYWESEYHHNVSIKRIDINSSNLHMLIKAKHPHFNISYDLEVLEPTRETMEIHVNQTYECTNELTLSQSRINKSEGFKIIQFSSMYINETYHDSDGLKYVDEEGELLTKKFEDFSTAKFLIDNPKKLGADFLECTHSDDLGWQGNTPNCIAYLDNLSLAKNCTPQGWITITSNQNKDNVGLWVHHDQARLKWDKGDKLSVSYSLIAQDDPEITHISLYVGGAGCGGKSPCYSSIQAAINAANENDTIIVKDGIYTENVNVNKQLTIRSENGSANCIVDAGGSGSAITLNADGVTVKGFTITNSGSSGDNAGVKISSDFNKITDNNIMNNSHGNGVYLDGSTNNTITESSVSNNYYGIYLDDSTNNTITESSVSNNYYGIYLDDSTNNTITESSVLNNNRGVYLWDYSNVNTIANNNLSKNDYCGIDLDYSSYNTVTNNSVSSSEYGIILHKSSNNTVDYNNASSNNWFDIRLDGSSNSTITNNVVTNGFLIKGQQPQHWNTHTIEDNTVNDNPLYYFKNQIGGKVPEDAGQVVLANCTGMRIENIDTNDTDTGIELGFSARNTIKKNIASGIYLQCSNNNKITNNNVYSNWNDLILIYSSITYNGIVLRDSTNNTITENNVSNNYYGIYLYDSSNNSITRNIVLNNGCCIVLGYSNINKIYLNNFINNSDKPFSHKSKNIWNSTEKMTYQYNNSTFTNYLGNYWDDYMGSDNNSDGIGDPPYPIGTEADNYPLLQPFENYIIHSTECGDVNCDSVIDISDVIRLLYYVGYPGQYSLCSEWAGDVTGDGTTDISDVIRLLYYVGYPGQYELNCKC